MALTTSYFIHELQVPDIVGADAIATANRESLERIILIREKEYLTYLLGKVGYDHYKANGATYTALDALLYDSVNLLSPVASYCYFYWKQQSAEYETGGGSVSAKHENSENKGMGISAINAYKDSILKGQDIIIALGNTYQLMSPDLLFFSKLANPFGI